MKDYRKITAIIDSDCLLYSVGFGKEKEEEDIAIAALDETIYGLLEVVQSDYQLLYLTSPQCFRKELYPAYKANREGKPKPKHYYALREHLEQVWCAEEVPYLEADDLCSLNYVDNETHTSIVCHIDKDINQVPGKHYSINRREFYEVSGYMARKFFYHQVLMGDAVDNIPGLKGIGEIRAAKMLADCHTEEDLFAAVDSAYRNKDELLLMAKLVWLRTNDRTNKIFETYDRQEKALGQDCTVSGG